MASLKRKPFQGIGNIIRFNWHFYVIAVALMVVLLCMPFPFYLVTIPVLISVVLSVVSSWYIYDYAPLYTLNWLDDMAGKNVVNIHAGFDETSALIADKFPSAALSVFDFYDPLKHTEVSIKRARKAYPPFPGTMVISTAAIPLQPASVDYICLILAAHEIRHEVERIDFFRQLSGALKPGGKIILVEHTRDLYNFLAYNLGCFHFLSRKSWLTTFAGAGLHIHQQGRITPFVSIYSLSNGITY